MLNDDFTPNNGITRAPASVSKTQHDDLILPGGARLGDTRKLASVLIAAGVPGVDHSQGRDINAAAYAAHLDKIGQEAAKAAVAAWIELQEVRVNVAQHGTSTMRNKTNSEGRELGRLIAKSCDDAEPKARLLMPDLPPRCNSCACRSGRHVANGSPQTQMDLLKCIMEGLEFCCHEPTREGKPCSGWAMLMLAKDELNFMEMPWDFSTAALGASDYAADLESKRPT